MPKNGWGALRFTTWNRGSASSREENSRRMRPSTAPDSIAGDTTTSTREAGIWDREATKKNGREGIVMGSSEKP
jgi:hypothetical protein